MPITWRSFPEHYGAPFTSQKRAVAISGNIEVGVVARHFGPSDSPERYLWTMFRGPDRLHGHTDTLEEGKAAIERAWVAWVANAGLKDDPDAKPMEPPLSGPRPKLNG